MYAIHVLNPGHPGLPLVMRFAKPAEVLEIVPRLLRDHSDCERLEIYSDDAFLFSVDCRSGLHGSQPKG